MLFGWLFLEAGTGLWLLGLGIVAMAAGIALRPTRGRALAAIVGFAAGCSPVIFLVLWFTVISG